MLDCKFEIYLEIRQINLYGKQSKDYKKMQLMIYGDPLSFDDIMDSLKILEDEINNL